jgi:hypothetical protein
MKKKRILFFLLLIGISVSTFAKKVEITDARLIAKNTYFEQYNRHNAILYQTIAITKEFVEKYNSHDVYYVFNINDKGFVIISADDICYPVIGFSFESSYSPSNQADGFAYWMNERKKEIAYNIENNITPNDNTLAMWQHLNNKDFGRLPNNPTSVQDVLPLCTSLWDQGFPYNEDVPTDSTCSSFNDHVTTGCVATAMSQIMYYWRWPNIGNGSHCYYTIKYGQLCAEFDTTHYDWNGMNDQPSSECLPLAILMSHAGISVNMDYNSDGQCSSGAYESDVPTALINYFRYSSSAAYVQANNYSTTNWNNLLQGDLNVGEIINYSGQGPEGGHSWVCDGYQATDYYHFNWGWSGSDDGYYYLNNLDPGGYTFNSSQVAVVHITPDPSQYPPYCSGLTDLTTDDYGTIEDGSGPVLNYQNNENCSWLIAPDDSVSKITLGFDRFATNTADILTVYDGPTTTSNVLGTFSGPNLPTGTVNSTGPQMLVTFVSTSNTTANGFLLTYNAIPIDFCDNSTTLTTATGSFSDGSGRFQYRNATACRWMIMPPPSTSITLTFSNFNTEPVNDKVQVYNIASNPPTLVGTYSGDHTSNPISPITINSGKAMVNWSTNKTNRGEGWDASYVAVTTGVNNQKSFEGLSVFPNPTDGLMNIKFTMNESQSVSMEILSLNGEIMVSQDFGSIQGSIDKQVDLSSLSKGIYILRLISDSGTTNEKIVLN